jgi:ATP-dependent Clp protease ATP-binding subunit ClpB
MDGIVDIQLALLERRLAPRDITLQVDAAARTWLADRGYDPVYGARPLKRVIQKALQDPLAELLLGGALHDGESLSVSAGEDGLILGDRARQKPGLATVH